MRATLSLLALIAGAAPALADVNIYSQRQPELIQPLLDAFTKQTGIKVNIAFIQNGIPEKLKAEGDRSPADLVLTVDVARLAELAAAAVTRHTWNSRLLRKSSSSPMMGDGLRGGVACVAGARRREGERGGAR